MVAMTEKAAEGKANGAEDKDVAAERRSVHFLRHFLFLLLLCLLQCVNLCGPVVVLPCRRYPCLVLITPERALNIDC